VLGPPARLLQGTDDDVNNSSVVLRLVYGEISFLLTGDLAAEGEQAVLAAGAEVHATVLKVGHHGSDGSSTQAFLAAVQPRLAVISAGADNTYGHPSPTTRRNLADVPVLRTDNNGDVRLHTDGKRLSVYLQRGRDKVTLPGTVK
jgi:competence protein ComEC